MVPKNFLSEFFPFTSPVNHDIKKVRIDFKKMSTLIKKKVTLKCVLDFLALKMEGFFVFIFSFSLLRSNVIKAIACDFVNLHDFVIQLTGNSSSEYLDHVADYYGKFGTKANIQYNVK